MKQIDRNFYDAAKMMADIDANHYPERMGITLIVNAPRAFSAVWAVVRPWLDENTASKIAIVSGERALFSVHYCETVPCNCSCCMNCQWNSLVSVFGQVTTR